MVNAASGSTRSSAAPAPKLVAVLSAQPGALPGDMRVQGEIVVPQAQLQALADKVAGGLTNTRDAKVRFDPARGTFVITGAYTGLGFWQPRFELSFKPQVVNGRIALRIDRYEHPGPHWLVDDYLMRKVARCMTDKGFPADYDARSRAFLLDADEILHERTQLPRSVDLDLSNTPLAVKSDAAGDLIVDLGSPPAQQPTRTEATVRFDGPTLQRLFNEKFGDAFEVEHVTFGPGHLTLNGKAHSDTLEGIEDLFAVLGAALGANPDAPDGRLDASIDIDQKADKLWISPSFHSADVLAGLAAALNKAGMPATVVDSHVEIDASAFAPSLAVDSLSLSADGLVIHGSPTVDKVLR